MSRTYLLFVLAISFICPGGPARAASTAAGTWTGTYVCAQGRTGATVIIRDNGAHLTGEFSFYPLRGHDNPPGKYRLRVSFDETKGEVALLPSGWIERPPGYRSIPLVGVLSPDNNRMFGQVKGRGCGTFEFVRKGTAQATAPAPETAFGPVRLSPSRTQTCRDFAQWSTRLQREFPGADLRRIRRDDFYDKAANLFSDDAMIAFIGKPFDRLTNFERENVIWPALTYCTRGWKGRAAFTWQNAITLAFRPTRGGSSADEITRLVARNRLERQWTREAAAVIKASEPTERGLGEIRRLRSRAEQAMAHLWPSERSAFDGLAAKRLRDLALSRARARLASAPDSREGLKGIEAALTDARRDGVETMLGQDVALRRAEIRAAMAKKAAATVSDTAKTLEGLRSLVTRREALIGTLGKQAVVSNFDPAVAPWAKDALAEILQAVEAKLRDMPDTLAGVGQVKALHQELGEAIALLDSAASARFEAVLAAREDSMRDTIEREARKTLAQYVPDSWTQLETLPEWIEAEALNLGVREKSAKELATEARTRIPELAQVLYPGFSSELNDMVGWTGLAELDLVGLRVTRIASKRSGFDVYEKTVHDRHEALMAEVTAEEKRRLDSWGDTYKDVTPLLAAADDIASSFETLDETDRANTLVDAALARAETLAAHSLEPFVKTLEALPNERERPPRLMEDAKEFVELARFAPSFEKYAEALRDRAVDMELALCEPAFAATGLPAEVADVPLVAGDGTMSVFRFACLLDRNGHALQAMEIGEDGTSVRMRIAQADGTTAIALLHEIGLEKGAPLLAGFELGDPKQREEIQIAAWRSFTAGLARDRPSGAPDASGVTVCDRVAADPDDPRRKVDGVTMDALDLAYATEACLAAVEHNPSTPRLRYQLARVLRHAGDEAGAGPLFEELAKEKYPAAEFARAEMLIIQDDRFDEAVALYRAAAAAGYAPAKEQVAMLTLPADGGAVTTMDAAPIAADPEPTEAEMRAAFSAATRSQYDCDIVLGCNIMGLMHIQLTQFKKHACDSLGNSKQLCSYSGYISCRTRADGIYAALTCGSYGSFGPTEKVFLNTGSQWRLME